MRLTDVAIRRVALRDKPFRLADGKGLALLVKPNGSKYWQFRYRFANKGKLLSLGVYHEVTLAVTVRRRSINFLMREFRWDARTMRGVTVVRSEIAWRGRDVSMRTHHDVDA